MLPCIHPDRIQVAFDNHLMVANARLTLPATLSLHLGMPQESQPAPPSARSTDADVQMNNGD